MSRDAFYGRVSGPGDTRQASIETQLEACERHLGRAIPPQDRFIDRFTGKLLHERPALSQLRERIRSGAYRRVLIYCIDRLSREQFQTAVILEEWIRARITIDSVTEPLEDSPEGKFLVSVRSFIAEVERAKIADRTGRGKARLLEQGKLIMSGKCRLGYRYDKTTRKRVVQEEEAQLVRRIFASAAGGTSIRQIVLRLNHEQLPTPRQLAGQKPGKKGWHRDVILKILRDRSYYGEPMHWQQTKYTGKRHPNGRGQFAPVADDEQLILGPPTPVLVDRETWETAQLVIDRHSNFCNHVGPTKRFSLLSGMIRCSCGSNMTIQRVPKWKDRGEYVRYVCDSKRQKSGCKQPRVWVETVEQEVWTRVAGLIGDEAAVRRAIAQAQGGTADLAAERAVLERALAEAEERAGRLVGLLADSLDVAITEATRTALAGLSHELATHRRALCELVRREASLQNVHAHMETALSLVQSCLDSVLTINYTEDQPVNQPRVQCSVPALTPEERRKVLQHLGARVTLHGRDVGIELNIPVVDQTCVPRGIVPARFPVRSVRFPLAA